MTPREADIILAIKFVDNEFLFIESSSDGGTTLTYHIGLFKSIIQGPVPYIEIKNSNLEFGIPIRQITKVYKIDLLVAADILADLIKSTPPAEILCERFMEKGQCLFE